MPLVAAHDIRAVANQARQRPRQIGNPLILRRLEELTRQILVARGAVLGLVDDDSRAVRIGGLTDFDAERTSAVIQSVQAPMQVF